MANIFQCKVASFFEIEAHWDAQIEKHEKDRENWIAWKERALKNYSQGHCLVYYGMLEGRVICEATAHIHPQGVQNSANLVSEKSAYLCAFRTSLNYQGRGYFSLLFQFMLNDLRRRGYCQVTLGVEPAEIKNKRIYAHYGFTTFIKSAQEQYPDGTIIEVEYYKKSL